MTEFLEVGRITRAHGLRGEVVVSLISDRHERLAPGAALESQRGTLVVVSSRPHQKNWIVQFEGIEGRDAAETWRGVALSAEPIDDPDALFVHDLVGCRVVDAQGGDRGVVTALQANPASDLLVLDGGALVPLVFVIGSPADGVIRVDTPPGLFELYD